MNRSAILITKNEELYKSFKRALQTLESIEATSSTKYEYIANYQNKDYVIIIDSICKDDIERPVIFYRLNNWLNPLINLVTKKEVKFVDSGLFYIIVPFDLKDLLDIISCSKHITGDEVVMFIVSWFSKESHDIRNMLNNREGRDKCIALINQVFGSLDESLKLSQTIVSKKNEIVKEIKDLSMDKTILTRKIMDLFEALKELISRR